MKATSLRYFFLIRRLGNQAGDRGCAGRGIAQVATKGDTALNFAAGNGDRINEPRASLDDGGVVVGAPITAVEKLAGPGDALDADTAVGRKTLPAQRAGFSRKTLSVVHI